MSFPSAPLPDENPYHAPSQSSLPSYGASYGEQSGMAPPEAIETLRQTKPWVRLMSVFGFIATAIVVLAISLPALIKPGGPEPEGIGAMIGAMIVGVIYFFPSLFLFQYASRIGALMRSGRRVDLDYALQAQRSFWRFVGVIAIIVLGIYVLAIAVVVLRTVNRV